MVVDVILLFDNLPICALAKRNSGTRKIAGDVIIDFCNLPVLPVLHRNSSTGCSSLRCRGGTESGLGKRVTVAPDGHASRFDAFRVNWRRVVNVVVLVVTLVR